ncbi:MAG: ABC transporter permease [Candidatus Odinarchaeota archaeon]
MANKAVLEARTTKGLFSGLNNLLNSEFSRWRTKDWYITAGIWTVIINAGLLSMLSYADTGIEEGLFMLGLMFGMFPMINVVIHMQDEIISHRESGTIAWLLSKPVSRSSFVLSKVIGNFIGFSVSIAIIPGTVTYLLIFIFKGVLLSPIQYSLGILLIAVYQLFYLTLTLMLGTMFKQRGGVIGIPLALGLGYNFLGFIPYIDLIHPMGMFFPSQDGLPLFGNLVLGNHLALESFIPFIIMVAMILIFIGVAFWKFNEEEF